MLALRQNRLWPACLVAASILVAVTPGTSLAQKRFALVIGNSAYAPAVGDKLKNPLNDSKLVATALRQIRFETIVKEDATRVDIKREVSRLAARLGDAGEGAIGFLYYSGHGVARAQDRANYLIPVDVRDMSNDDFWYNAVSLDEIVKEFRTGAPRAALFLVFDACRSELRLPVKSTSKGFESAPSTAGAVIAFSTSPNETASDVGDTGGPYARALASELVVSGQDQLRLFQNVKRRVYGLTGKRQQPWESYGIVGEIFLGGEVSKSATESLPKSDEVSLQVAEDQPAKYPETDKTRVSSFSWISPPNEFKPGIRKWTRISSDRWQEEYLDGTKNISLIRKRINVGGCDGSVISGPLEEDFQGFIPDKGCLNMTFLFRRLPTRKWTSYVPLTNIR